MLTKKFSHLLGLAAAIVGVVVVNSCTKLTQSVSSVVPNSEYWQTPAQIQAGIAAAYNTLTGIGPSSGIGELCTASTDEMIIPIRGADWLDGDEHIQEWLHTWTSQNPNVNSAWSSIANGIGQCNFVSSVVNSLPTPPSNLSQINAELRTLRDFYYWLAIDAFGDFPYITNYNTNPNTVSQTPRAQIYDSIVADLQANAQLLPANVDATTYGQITKWFDYTLLAKLYLNSEVYTNSVQNPGTSGGIKNYAQCVSICDSIINSGLFSLSQGYFDNFSPTNGTLLNGGENIFCVPYNKVSIGGQNWEMQTLHYQNQINFKLSGQPWNGFCTTADFYYTFDTSSVYTTTAGTTYRTFNDQRTGQYLIGQQFNAQYNYPPDKNVIVASTNPDISPIQDVQFSIPLVFSPTVATLSDASGGFRGAGVRNIKYFPEAGTSGNQDNNYALFRLADIYLMRAEADIRANGSASATSVNLVNAVRTRAYNGSTSNNWAAGQVTLANILAERGRELAWECVRRTDQIRYEVTSGTPYFTAARNPQKTQDADAHTLIFPVPAPQMTSNPNLKQNPEYN
ncbi:MAG TPA: RagB/SusD family nutrient uptake outer membrane protein [Puia sp.]|nr:RagB/SusD family nutrient uptake outer membrane protein [Puia sp.]